jgi:SAM-dependent methyltransferase
VIAEYIKGPLERGRGFFDFIDCQEGRLVFGGWLFVPDWPFDDFSLKVNGRSMAGARIIDRPDVNEAFGLPATTRCGFQVDAGLGAAMKAEWVDIAIVGKTAGVEVAIISTIFKPDFRAGLSDPPGHLMRHVIGSDSRDNYWAGSLMAYGEFRLAMQRNISDPQIGRLLDWGCGCGRMTSMFLKHSEIAEIYGCDIEAEAIDWCRAHLARGSFDTIFPNPPTAYPGDYFGAIVSNSVFTHLTRGAQTAWLGEMSRILRPGGFLFASCHGDFATSFADISIREEVARDGISDRMPDANLAGVVPSGDYRTTYQTAAYTVAEFGKQIRVVEYLPRAIGSLQDLVVMQK